MPREMSVMAEVLVTADQIHTHFSPTRRDTQGTLPLLIRQLILETVPLDALESIRVPVLDDVRLAGWDGRIELSGTHPFIPTGASAWEMGTAGDPQRKASSDLAKRTSSPGGLDPSQTTFVFVTPHHWHDKSIWIDAQKSHSPWKHLRVLDAQDLELWLSIAPAAAVRLAREMGRDIDDVESSDQFWNRALLHTFGPVVSPELIIGGRTSSSDAVLEWIRGGEPELFIQCESSEEAIAFLIAALRGSESQPGATALLDRILILHSARGLQYIAGLGTTHLIALTDPALLPRLRGLPTRQSRIVIPDDSGLRAEDTVAKPTIRLGRVKRDAIRHALTSHGMDLRKAEQIAEESRGSLAAVLWSLGLPSQIKIPWTEREVAAELAPLLLVRRWRATEPDADHQIIESISGRSYASLRGLLVKWSGPKGPLRLEGDLYTWTAWSTAWRLIASQLTPDLLKRFRDSATRVFTLSDPVLDLPETERAFAALYGRKHPYSTELRAGIADAIAMCAVHSSDLTTCDGAGLAHGIVRSILQGKDPATAWVSVSRWLPTLAEASPEAFLDAAEELAADSEQVAVVFQGGDVLFGSHPYVSVLWALELLAIHPQYLSRAAFVLAELASKAPPSPIANSPERSLCQIFVPWHPATNATVEDRLSVVQRLFDQFPRVVFRCAVNWLPQSGATTSGPPRVRFRSWEYPHGRSVPIQDYWRFVGGIVASLLDRPIPTADDFFALLERLPSLLNGNRELGSELGDYLAVQAASGLDASARTRAWTWTSQIVERYEDCHDRERTLDATSLDLLRQIRDQCAPTDIFYRARRLFSYWPERPLKCAEDRKEQDKRIATDRQAAVRTIYDSHGLKELLDWSSQVEVPEFVGGVLAQIDSSQAVINGVLDHAVTLAPSAIAHDPQRRATVQYLRSVAHEGGLVKLVSVFGHWTTDREPPEILIAALAMPPGIPLWELLDCKHSTVASSYWKRVVLGCLSLDEVEHALPRLAECNRAHLAIRVVAQLLHEVTREEVEPSETSRLTRLCIAAIQITPDPLTVNDSVNSGGQMFSHDLEAVLLQLDSVAATLDLEAKRAISTCEWRWVRLLEHSSRGLRMLHEQLALDAGYFVELLCLLYAADTDDEGHDPQESAHADDDQKRLRAEHAYCLLHSLRVVPGTVDPRTVPSAGAREMGVDRDSDPIRPYSSGVVDGAKLDTWVDTGRIAAQAQRRESIFLHWLGQIMAYAPSDPDGRWPCTPVRRCIERLRSTQLDSGLRIAIYNRRGTHFVGPTGDAERRLADHFEAMAAKCNDAPRTAAILSSIAQGYRREALQRDKEGEQQEFDR